MFANSIRWRLQLWLGFLLVCVLSGFAATVYQLHRINRFQQIDEELERRVMALARSVRGPGRPPFGERGGRPPFVERGGPPPGERRQGNDGPGRRRGPMDMFDSHGPPELREVRLLPQTLNLFDQADTNDFYFGVWSRSGIALKISTNAPAGVARPERLGTDIRTHFQMRDRYRESFHFTELGDCVLTGRDISADLTAMAHFTWWLVGAGATVLALGLGGGWRLASRIIRPVEEISAAASRISAGNLSERISIAEADVEVSRLAGVLNSTFARLESAFAQQKQFTADASHELRTPLAAIISEAQATLARERSAAEYREAIEVCLDTAQQMRRLTHSLLELARFDAGEENIARQEFDLSERIRACADLVRPLAAERNIIIESELQSVLVKGDPDRLGQVITNLLTNAIHYNKDGGKIRVETRAQGGVAMMTVADTGQGIGPEDLAHVFERFYRGDKARAQSNGRSGLGLAISKAIIEAHGGTIEVASAPGVGSTFTVRLPT